MNKNNGYPIWIIRLRQQEPGSIPHVFAPNHVDESKPELVQTAVRPQRRRKIRCQWKTLAANFDRILEERVNEANASFDRCRITGSTKVDNRSYRDPVTACRFEPRRRRAGGDATMNTNECSSEPRGHHGFFPPPNAQLPSV